MAPDEVGDSPIAAEPDGPIAAEPDGPIEPDEPVEPIGSDGSTGSGSGPGAELGALFISTRATVLLVVTAGLAVLSAWGVTRFLSATPMGFQGFQGGNPSVQAAEIVQILSSAAVVAALGPLLLGALAGPLAFRRRDEVASGMGARAFAHAVVALIYGVVAVVLVAGTILVVADIDTADLTSPDVLRAMLGVLVAYPLWALIGVGVGALVGSPAVAASAVLLWPYLESALRNGLNSGGSPASVGQYLPVQVTAALATGGYQGSTLELSPMSMVTALAVLVAWTAVFLGAGVVASMARLPAPAADEPAGDGFEPDAPVPTPI